MTHFIGQRKVAGFRGIIWSCVEISTANLLRAISAMVEVVVGKTKKEYVSAVAYSFLPRNFRPLAHNTARCLELNEGLDTSYHQLSNIDSVRQCSKRVSLLGIRVGKLASLHGKGKSDQILVEKITTIGKVVLHRRMRLLEKALNIKFGGQRSIKEIITSALLAVNDMEMNYRLITLNHLRNILNYDLKSKMVELYARHVI